jgi:ABC-type polysaccharide/polyol phosphate transport system ATPase subunit
MNPSICPSDIAIKVEKGETFGIIGRNGLWKST